MENLKEKRIELGMTQSQVAKQVGVSLMSYQLWERQVTKPNDIKYYKLKKVLKLK